MNINYEYYRIFYQVAKYGNFTKAAHVLGSSQPNITRAMNSLEQQAHCTLFIRTNRGVRLTPEGQQLYTRVSAAMLQLQAAEEELAESTGLAHGSIAIGASETALNIYLLDTLRAFHMAHPGIRLKIYNHSTPQAIRSVSNGEIDFAVVTTPTELEAPLQEIRLRPFREILVGGKTFAPLCGQRLTLADLQQYPLISLGQETMTYRFYAQWFLAHGLTLAPDTEAATADQLLPLVQCELGLAFVPEPMAQAALARQDIVQLSLLEQVPPRQVCMVYDRHRPLGTAAQRLKNHIAADRLR